jgi:hypothetical protein
VRVLYSRNVARGQWGAHGRYVARESTARGDGDRAGGFDDRAESVAAWWQGVRGWSQWQSRLFQWAVAGLTLYSIPGRLDVSGALRILPSPSRFSPPLHRTSRKFTGSNWT